MISVDDVKNILKSIFLDAIGFDPFKDGDDYSASIDSRFGLDYLDIMELVLRIEKQFNFTISNDEIDRIKLMNINKIEDFVSKKLKLKQFM